MSLFVVSAISPIIAPISKRKEEKTSIAWQLALFYLPFFSSDEYQDTGYCKLLLMIIYKQSRRVHKYLFSTIASLCPPRLVPYLGSTGKQLHHSFPPCHPKTTPLFSPPPPLLFSNPPTNFIPTNSSSQCRVSTFFSIMSSSLASPPPPPMLDSKRNNPSAVLPT